MGMPELYQSSFDMEEFERFSLAKTLKKKKKEETETEEESEEETEEESDSEAESEDEYKEIADPLLLEYVQ